MLSFLEENVCLSVLFWADWALKTCLISAPPLSLVSLRPQKFTYQPDNGANKGKDGRDRKEGVRRGLNILKGRHQSPVEFGLFKQGDVRGMPWDSLAFPLLLFLAHPPHLASHLGWMISDAWGLQIYLH